MITRQAQLHPLAMSYILEVGPDTYVGGPMTSNGYGTTKIPALAISFSDPNTALDWCWDNNIHAAIIERNTGKCVMA